MSKEEELAIIELIKTGDVPSLDLNAINDAINERISKEFRCMQSALSEFCKRRTKPRPEKKPKLIRLYPREVQVCNLVRQGLRNKEIATKLGVTEGTIKIYVSKIFRVLGVKSRAELILYREPAEESQIAEGAD